MENIENKTNDQLIEELTILTESHLKLKEQMLKEWDLMLSMEKRGKEVYNALVKRRKGINE